MMTNVFLAFLEISASTSLVITVLILVTPFLNKRYAAKWKYLIWIFLALRLLIPFRGADMQTVMEKLLRMGTRTELQFEEEHTEIPADMEAAPRRVIVRIPSQMTAPIAMQSGKNNSRITLLDIAAFVWILGSLVFLLTNLISYAHYKRQMMKRGNVIKDRRILRQMLELKRELHIKRTVQVIEYSEAASPMIMGFLKPVLVLPKEEYSAEDVFFILKHELVHLKRGDIYVKLLFMAANALHWFNPLIWMMQKEAAIDMELSCDEKVTQGADYAVRKAYTETLLSTLHKQWKKRTVLSTQFYDDKQIMKKRFQNILKKNRKRNGAVIFILAAIFTIGLGTLVECSAGKENTENITGQEGNAGQTERAESDIADESTAVPADDISDGEVSNMEAAAENTRILTIIKEGEPEEKQATLVIGNGYSLYLPDDEQWHLSAPDLWTTDINEQVALWITHFEGESVNSVNQELKGDDYAEEDSHKWWKQEGDLIYHVEQKVFENNVWGIFYSYPVDFEDGWGREFPVIVNTFAILNGADNEKTNNTVETGEYLGAEDCQKIRTVLEAFAESYFDGDVDAIQKLLACTYEGEVDIYEGKGVISDLIVKGLSDADEKKIENGKCNVSIEFRDSNYEDMFLYLTLILVKEQGDWKIQFYGVEG